LSIHKGVVPRRWASGTSKGTEIKLTNVAWANLEELLEDWRDFMRDHDMRATLEHKDLAIRTNVIVGLIKVTNYLQDQ